MFKDLVDVSFPTLTAYLEQQLGVDVSSVSTNWFLCIFVNSLPLESCLRVWDIFFLEGCSSVLFRVALALVDVYYKVHVSPGSTYFCSKPPAGAQRHAVHHMQPVSE